VFASLPRFGQEADHTVSACVAHGSGTPQSYADAFRRLQTAALIDDTLADRLLRAPGFRDLVAHACERLDMTRVHQAARTGPADLRALVAAIARAAHGPVRPA
jgi:uncharacterized protein YutE (UPF0331/DUF86 family)